MKWEFSVNPAYHIPRIFLLVTPRGGPAHGVLGGRLAFCVSDVFLKNVLLPRLISLLYRRSRPGGPLVGTTRGELSALQVVTGR